MQKCRFSVKLAVTEMIEKEWRLEICQAFCIFKDKGRREFVQTILNLDLVWWSYGKIHKRVNWNTSSWLKVNVRKEKNFRIKWHRFLKSEEFIRKLTSWCENIGLVRFNSLSLNNLCLMFVVGWGAKTGQLSTFLCSHQLEISSRAVESKKAYKTTCDRKTRNV